jgi:hypothetical protein
VPEKPKIHVPLTSSGELVDLASEMGEFAIDSLLSEGALRDFPLLGSAIGLARVARSVRDQLFLRKVAGFLGPLRDASSHERDRFADDLEVDAKERARAGENLLLLLERLDDAAKPEMIGKIYLAYLRSRISWRNLRLLSAAVDRLQVTYLDTFKDYYSAGGGSRPDPLALQHLANIGFLRVDLGSGAINDGGGSYSKSDLGALGWEILVVDASNQAARHYWPGYRATPRGTACG